MKEEAVLYNDIKKLKKIKNKEKRIKINSQYCYSFNEGEMLGYKKKVQKQAETSIWSNKSQGFTFHFDFVSFSLFFIFFFLFFCCFLCVQNYLFVHILTKWACHHHRLYWTPKKVSSKWTHAYIYTQQNIQTVNLYVAKRIVAQYFYSAFRFLCAFFFEVLDALFGPVQFGSIGLHVSMFFLDSSTSSSSTPV